MCVPGGMKIDEHPKLMALICTAVGIAGIGLILTIAFSDNDTMMGVGIALGVFGIAATILGCIHMSSAAALADTKKNDDLRGFGPENIKCNSLAPNKVPSPFEVSKGKIRGVDDDASPSPTRIAPQHQEDGQDGENPPDLGIGATRWAGIGNASPARGVLPPGPKSRHGGGGDEENQNPGTIYSHRTTIDISPDPRKNKEGNNQLGRSFNARNSSSQENSGGTVMSPFDKRSYPVPTALFPAEPRSAGDKETFEMKTGVSNAPNGFDRQTAQQQIRAHQDAVDAVSAAQKQSQGPVGFKEGERDEDALPKDFWQEKRN